MHVRGSFFHLQHLIYRPVVWLIPCRAISSAPQIALSKPLLWSDKGEGNRHCQPEIHRRAPPHFRPKWKGLYWPSAPLITGLLLSKSGPSGYHTFILREKKRQRERKSIWFSINLKKLRLRSLDNTLVDIALSIEMW